MKTCYLHIGHAKTATSALQSFMHAHDEIFAASGIWVPGDYREFGSFNCKVAAKSGQNFAGNCAPIFNATAAKNETLAKALLDHVFSRDSDVLLSSELMFYYRHFVRNIVKHANENGFSVVVIAYLRRQDRAVIPAYYQNIRNHGYFGDPMMFLNDTSNVRYFRYFEVISDWQVAPPNRAVLRTFEPEFLEQGNIIQDFLSVLGLTGPAYSEFRSERGRNQSLPVEAFEIIRGLNALGRKDLVAMVIKASSAISTPEDGRRANEYYYRRVIADIIENDYFPDNALLADSHLYDRSEQERLYWVGASDVPKLPPLLDPVKMAKILDEIAIKGG